VSWVDGVSAVFVGVSAVVTAGMAWQTRRLAEETQKTARSTERLSDETRGMAEATKAMATETARVAQASESEAEATKALIGEAQQDRALSWSPYLTGQVIESTTRHEADSHGPRGLSQKVLLTNLGKGPARRCFYFACDPSNVGFWCTAQHPGLRGDETIELRASAPQTGETPMYLLHLRPHDQGNVPAPFAAMFCEDVFGNRIRFIEGRWGRDIWHPGDDYSPTWATTPLLWS
jgi:hypothetical protein